MREQILHMLAEAAEMEHNLLCCYLYAAFSIRRESGDMGSQAEAGAVSRWRRSVMSVAVQEMGHLAIVNNLMVALGGTPHFDRPNFPVPPGYHPSGFGLRLAPFDEPTLEHFIFLERPDGAPLRDADGFDSENAVPREAERFSVTPSSPDYRTIADLYRSIRRQLRLLAAARGSRAFVCTERQVSAEDIGIAGVAVIRDLAGAFAALEIVVEQGEGGRSGSRDSHFARFSAIKEEWAKLKENNPEFAPAHPAARDPVMRPPAEGLERVWITAPEAAGMLDVGNALYGALLSLLAQLYQPLAPAQRKAIAGGAMELMHGLARAGEALARLPAAQETPQTHAGLTFAVPRVSGARADMNLLAERLEELAPAYARVFGERANPLRAAASKLAKPSVG